MSAALENSRELDECANRIRAIGKRAVAGIIEIGRLLTGAKILAGHGNWLTWLDREFGWSGETARRWMMVYEVSLKFHKSCDLEIPLSSLYFLTAKSTPQPVLAEVIARSSRASAPLSAVEIKSMIEAARPPRHTIPAPPPPASQPPMLSSFIPPCTQDRQPPPAGYYFTRLPPGAPAFEYDPD
ncbi:MAG: DUF3102 domain-containing protein, partial [Pseudomonadota bacterium]|nr:DUF3102 domain-containing protein [Pseudomonadota bacterium]